VELRNRGFRNFASGSSTTELGTRARPQMSRPSPRKWVTVHKPKELGAELIVGKTAREL